MVVYRFLNHIFYVKGSQNVTQNLRVFSMNIFFLNQLAMKVVMKSVQLFVGNFAIIAICSIGNFIASVLCFICS